MGEKKSHAGCQAKRGSSGQPYVWTLGDEGPKRGALKDVSSVKSLESYSGLWLGEEESRDSSGFKGATGAIFKQEAPSSTRGGSTKGGALALQIIHANKFMYEIKRIKKYKRVQL